MKLVIPDLVHKKIMHWVNTSDNEVSGLGKVTCDANGIVTVLDVLMLPQKNGKAHTDIEAADVCKAMHTLRDTPGVLRFFWHSHVMMQVFWSGQDKETIKLCGQGGWCVASVFNQKLEVRSAFFSVDGMSMPWGKAPLFLDEITTECGAVAPELVALWDEEYKRNVKPAVLHEYDFTKGNLSNRQILGDGGTTGPLGYSKVQGKKPSKKQLKAIKELEKQGSLTPLNTDVPDMFDADDRMVMYASGYTADDIIKLEDETYFSPIEILELVTAKWSAAEILWASSYAEGKGISAIDMIAAYTPQAARVSGAV